MSIARRSADIDVAARLRVDARSPGDPLDCFLLTGRTPWMPSLLRTRSSCSHRPPATSRH